MDEIEEYAIITMENKVFGQIDIRVSRELPLKEIIYNLASAIGARTNGFKGFYAKAMKSNQLISPTETLKEKNIYDGEVLRIL